MEPAALRLVLPGNVRHNSGGNAYNAALLRAVEDLGVPAEACEADGDWPVGSPADRRQFGRVLTDADGGRVTLVDGLVACGAPDELEAAADAGMPAWILLHMPLGSHPELERRALQAAAGVICTSGTAAADLRERHGIDGIRVALPGTAPAPPAAGSQPPHLLAVAALLPNKDQLLLLRALAGLTDLPWTASFVGSDTADPAYSTLLRREAAALGLAGRIRLPGELRGAALDAEWAAADLSLLISRAETYGLVVTESLARGIPVIVRQGTGAVEALAAGTPAAAAGGSVADSTAGTIALPGTAVALAGDPAPLAAVLRRWLTEPALRARWRDAALAAREHLPGWDATARAVLAILGIEPQPHPTSSQ
ncbi:glycosyltransferase [Arthrobacter sp. UKPF54-2]|uniref:glycosyltransferase n=1 Tax=Arthrobacter sp. UKPF54-2 TaxID=2600159 RepID=UPI0011B1B101|nr:glycosyltransferase [Arthrobacter sp. UKPF54-2]QDY89298.1 glycosyltransferase [Arthrobacter sp. UKPF54-2]